MLVGWKVYAPGVTHLVGISFDVSTPGTTHLVGISFDVSTPGITHLVGISFKVSTPGITHLVGISFKVSTKLQALVYDILPSSTAVFSYAIGSRKLSANEQFFVGAQTMVSLLQTTQIKQGVSFIAANKVSTSTNKTTIV